MKTIFSDEPIQSLPNKSIFLAGPTSRTNDFDLSWRKEALQYFEDFNFDGTVCIPEFKEKRSFEISDWDTQVNWEWTLLDNADCIMFWIPRNMETLPGLTTNLEFGTYLEKCPEKVILGYPDTACHMTWLLKRYNLKAPGNKISNTLRNTVIAAVKCCEVNNSRKL